MSDFRETIRSKSYLNAKASFNRNLDKLHKESDSRVTALERSIGDSTQNIQVFRNQIEELQLHGLELSQQIVDSEKEIQLLSDRYWSLKNRKSKLSLEREALFTQVQNLEEKITENESSIADMRREIKQEEENFKAKMDKLSENYEKPEVAKEPRCGIWKDVIFG
ncbi:Oidioi.mRNA.OKI2018_I69.chr1.g1677.t1.cds [Oikopleura dioica]|uniref:Oidioi.mRNA.OKI2018_I69.chr1.g1677.t1.cds n=1 Tax=Oikopleura dioica TaxID=34765 RepID=A0ABN7SXT7_OIKDI|nr:Oidioi.mRNA.OKI2018_I69.chr1.g1677.t1.cds [Oikopleura dioica]